MGQGLSGVVTRNPDIEPVRAMERNIKINRERERKRERVGYNNMRSTSDVGTKKLIQLLLLLF